MANTHMKRCPTSLVRCKSSHNFRPGGWLESGRKRAGEGGRHWDPCAAGEGNTGSHPGGGFGRSSGANPGTTMGSAIPLLGVPHRT